MSTECGDDTYQYQYTHQQHTHKLVRFSVTMHLWFNDSNKDTHISHSVWTTGHHFQITFRTRVSLWWSCWKWSWMWWCKIGNSTLPTGRVDVFNPVKRAPYRCVHHALLKRNCVLKRLSIAMRNRILCGVPLWTSRARAQHEYNFPSE